MATLTTSPGFPTSQTSITAIPGTIGCTYTVPRVDGPVGGGVGVDAGSGGSVGRGDGIDGLGLALPGTTAELAGPEIVARPYSESSARWNRNTNVWPSSDCPGAAPTPHDELRPDGFWAVVRSANWTPSR